MKRRMNDSVLLLASVIPMWMAVLLILSAVLEKLSKQLPSLPNHTALFVRPAVLAHLLQSKRRRKRRKIEDAGQRAVLLDERGRRVQRRRSTGQNLSPRNENTGLLLQRANVNQRTRRGNGLEVQHQLLRAGELIAQLLPTLLLPLILLVVGLEVLLLKLIQQP